MIKVLFCFFYLLPVVIPGSSSQEKSVVVNIFEYIFVFFVSFLSTDKHETKLKGVIYFQAIEEVYYDHLRSATKVVHLIRVSLLLPLLLVCAPAVTEGPSQLEYVQRTYPRCRLTALNPPRLLKPG